MHWNIPSTFISLNSKTKYFKLPYLQLYAILYISYSATGVRKYPSCKSGLEKYLAPYSLLKSSSMCGKGVHVYNSVFI